MINSFDIEGSEGEGLDCLFERLGAAMDTPEKGTTIQITAVLDREEDGRFTLSARLVRLPER